MQGLDWQADQRLDVFYHCKIQKKTQAHTCTDLHTEPSRQSDAQNKQYGRMHFYTFHNQHIRTYSYTYILIKQSQTRDRAGYYFGTRRRRWEIAAATQQPVHLFSFLFFIAKGDDLINASNFESSFLNSFLPSCSGDFLYPMVDDHHHLYIESGKISILLDSISSTSSSSCSLAR